MSQNNQTQFNNLAANAARFLKLGSTADRFGTLFIKCLRLEISQKLPHSKILHASVNCLKYDLFCLIDFQK